MQIHFVSFRFVSFQDDKGEFTTQLLREGATGSDRARGGVVGSAQWASLSHQTGTLKCFPNTGTVFF